MKIALFGGSFNPVHNGHIKMVKTIHNAGYDQVIVIPTFHSPFKALPADSTNQDRINMLQLAFSDHDFVKIETCEIDRQGVSYTIDTVNYLQEKYSAKRILDGKFGLLIGSDLLKDFDKWKTPDELAKLVDIILVTRPNEDSSIELQDFQYKHTKIQNELCNVSSTNIRRLVSEKRSISDFVPKSVEEYILQKGLYIERL